MDILNRNFKQIWQRYYIHLYWLSLCFSVYVRKFSKKEKIKETILETIWFPVWVNFLFC